jgi:AcrR family transcriptional regulator
VLRYAVNVGRRQIHDETTATALLDAAEAIVEAEGPDALTVRRVADRVGTTTRAVYSSLGSKDALLAALCARAFELLGAFVAQVPPSADPAADLVTAATMGFRRWALEHPALFRIGFVYQLSLPAAVFDAAGGPRLRALDALYDLIRRVERAGGLGGRTVVEATAQIDALCEGLAIMDMRCPDQDTTSRWTDALNALVAGWRLVPAPPPGDTHTA